MQQLKNILRTRFPGVYKILTRTKDFFVQERWGNYYNGQGSDSLHLQPERCLIELKPALPHYVDTIFDLGCGAGRNFVPFAEECKLVGLDIVPEKRIRWVRPFENLTYLHSSVEAFTRRIEKENLDMSTWLVFSCGTLMYVSEEYQRRFFEACTKRGCKNFIIEEPAPGTTEDSAYFKMSPDFFTESRRFRVDSKQLMTYIKLDTMKV